ncbi:protein-glutamate O-methyltransferase CheR [uncultured Roseobacter sp.]|uniref:CheR family methyltransferase n=1 Tax=uncultured Roseobacter sp. TaxID=114847 RepID=UPI0026203D3E|nr:protein-glutamate O-methyltransferase CheR [uncultured Roseobacter sp.]
MKGQVSDNGITAESFDAIAQLAYRESGLQLAVEKTSMIQSRLRHRLRALNIPDFEGYSAFVCSEAGRQERRHMISALTTNVSHFFREKHHFDVLSQALKQKMLPDLRAGKQVRIWSAGASNGQEALSIAMTLLKVDPAVSDFDVRILATDIDANVIKFANEARYPERLTSGIPNHDLDRYFSKEVEGAESFYYPNKALKDLITFRELNLLSSWPMKQKMDVIFCRNVVIYFDLKTQNNLWPRFHNILKSDGYLFLGHSERIAEPEVAGFRTSGPTTYRPVFA